MNEADVVIYHNPRCSKSRQTLALIEARGIDPTVVCYLDTPPSAAQVGRLIDQLGIEPHQLLRKKEAAYAKQGLTPSSSRAMITEAIAASPTLLERPVVVVGELARLGRPPEQILEILPE